MNEEKLELQRSETLKLFLFLGRPGKLQIKIEGEVPFYTLAYNEEQARMRAIEYINEKSGLNADSCTVVPFGGIEFEDLIQLVKVRKSEFEEETQKPSEEQFVYNLKWARDEYIKDKKDKLALTRAINKVEKTLTPNKETKKEAFQSKENPSATEDKEVS